MSHELRVSCPALNSLLSCFRVFELLRCRSDVIYYVLLNKHFCYLLYMEAFYLLILRRIKHFHWNGLDFKANLDANLWSTCNANRRLGPKFVEMAKGKKSWDMDTEVITAINEIKAKDKEAL